jgi:hypothetical protein
MQNPIELLIRLLNDPDKWTFSDMGYTCFYYCSAIDLHVTCMFWFDAVVKFEGQIVSMPFWQRIRVANAVRKLKKLKTQQRVKYLQERLTKALQPKETEK